jgi:FkbM family methyltransferase
MVTKDDKIEKTFRGIANSLYWGLWLRAGRNRIERTLGTTSAVFLVEDESDGWKYWRHGGDLFGERAVIHDASVRIEPDDTFWDVGGADGVYSAYLGQHCAEVVAFEPSSERVERLRRTLELNEVDATIRQHALGSQDGFARLNEDHSIEYADEAWEGAGGFDVRRGDTVSPDPLPSPDVMKIDTEGAELDVLRGMGSLLSNVRTIYIEPHPSKYHLFDTDWTEIEACLTDFSFKLEAVASEKTNHLYRATRSKQQVDTKPK